MDSRRPDTMKSLLSFLAKPFRRRKAPRPYRYPVGEMCDRFRERLAQWEAVERQPPTNRRVGVLITPWLFSGVPIFSLECAFRLRQAGYSVRLFWDATDIFGNASDQREVAPVAALMKDLPADIEVIDVAGWEDLHEHDDEGLAEAILHENAIHRMRGESRMGDFFEGKEGLLPATRKHIGKIHKLVKGDPMEFLFIPGGVYGLSAIYVAAAERLGIGITTYDCDYGMLIIAHGGVACHQVDLMDASKLLGNFLKDRPEEKERIKAVADAELQARIEGRDALRSQEVAAARRTEGDTNILIPLNLRWDTAALSRQRLFPSVEAWVLALLKWAESEPAARLCFRQHPGERHEVSRSVDDVGAIIERHNRVGDRVRLVAAADKVSTYDIMLTTAVVLPFTSTLGVEAAMLGKPIIISTKCYYERFPFARRAETEEEYFALLSEGLAGKLVPDAAARETAALVYYLTAICNMMQTVFTPAPNDVQKWLQVSPSDLWQRPENEDLLESLDSRCPQAFIRARRFARAAELAVATPAEV